MKRFALAIASVLLLASSVFAAAVPNSAKMEKFGPWYFQNFAKSGGSSPLSLAIGAPDFASITDLTPVSQYVNGWTASLTISSLTPGGSSSDYNLGWTPASPASNLVLNVSSPGYTSSAGTTSVSRTLYGTSYLREPYPNVTLPTESATGGARVALTLSDYVYSADTLVSSSVGAGLYTNGSASPSGAPAPTGASTISYPTPICSWVSPPGQRFDATASLTVEMYCAGAYSNGSGSVAAVTISANDGTHTVSHTTGTLAQSLIQVTSSCTATNGSNVLTSCGSTNGWIVGERATVPGIPGQPKLLSKTSNSLTFGVTNANCTTTTNSGNITFTTAALGDGEALADGALVGASVSGTNITTPANASIASATVSADVTITSGKATAAVVHTNATVTTAGTNASCTIAHNYQGTTGTVTAVMGVPVYDYQITFTSADLATLNDGNVWFRGQAYPVIGNSASVLDTNTGADGSNTDWNGVTFATNGTDISENLHNLWAYKDAAGTYVPVYAWVATSAGGTPAVQTSAADPGSGAYYASVSAAATALQTYYNANKSHNDANGGVICVVTGTTLAGFGGTITTTANKPPITLTSALSGGSCPVSGSAGSDITVSLNTGANKLLPAWTRVNNFLLTTTSSASIFQGNDTALPSTMPANSLVFNGDKVLAAYGYPMVYRTGAWWVYNSFIDQSSNDGNFLVSYNAATTNGAALIFGNTVSCATFSTAHAATAFFNALGNAMWGCTAATPGALTASLNTPQPVSLMFADNKVMGSMSINAFSTNNQANRVAIVNNVFECINDSAQSPCLRLSADSNNTPAKNNIVLANTVSGERYNSRYLEGVPLIPTCTTTGGSIPAGTWYFEVSYALVGNPTVETSTDGVLSQTTTGSTSSCSLAIPNDPNYVAYLSMGTTSTPDSTWTYGTYSGGDTKQLVMANSASCVSTSVGGCGWTVAITAVSATLHQPPTFGTGNGHNELKTLNFEKWNIVENYNIKGDDYAQSGAGLNGGRVGNWASRWHAGDLGNVWVTGSVIGGLGPSGGLGETLCPYCTWNTSNSATDLSWVVYKSDRSWGGHSASLISPALNLGEGDYCPVTSTTHAASLVPAGQAIGTVDVGGNARKNDGTGWAGAYEGATCF